MQAAYYALHYGKEYLAWSLRSIQDAVDKIFVFYTDRPSYGYSAGGRCPDTRDELKRELERFATKPIEWIDGNWHNEGEHRNAAVAHMRRAGVHQILVVDADEIWVPGAARSAIFEATSRNCAMNWGSNFVHFYRSTKHVCRDHFLPVRVIDVRHKAGSDTLTTPAVLHFGYAQSMALIRYKWTCHGHQSELRPGWLDRYAAWTPESEDLHPVVIGLWDRARAVEDDLADHVRATLHDHPYIDMDVIP